MKLRLEGAGGKKKLLMGTEAARVGIEPCCYGKSRKEKSAREN